jgi:hypothetical protein
LKYQKDLVCGPCRHGKMVAASHPPLTCVMTERPCELFHVDLVGLACVCSAGGKWYVLVIVDDYSCYAWVLLTVKIRQPSHEFTFGVGMSFIPYPLVLTPVV